MKHFRGFLSTRFAARHRSLIKLSTNIRSIASSRTRVNCFFSETKTLNWTKTSKGKLWKLINFSRRPYSDIYRLYRTTVTERMKELLRRNDDKSLRRRVGALSYMPSDVANGSFAAFPDVTRPPHGPALFLCDCAHQQSHKRSLFLDNSTNERQWQSFSSESPSI